MTILLPATCSFGAGPLGGGGAEVLVLGDGLVLGLAVGLVTAPVQGVPLRANDVGTGLAPFCDPMNPMDVDAPVFSDPFQARLVAETWAPD
ncbi:hypothetical protein ACTOB_004930 [Actinoplanes oblitus]|uniref:Uncharacterized protein n=1 Tax=Actinoplanes oblitus TaxID=3040509 RepID=A0ABY8WV69_9ACTN|nr:hypothetical protein [Actinoplanes oblitus]WIN01027.1 hypothetical protein ACTOB_004930 [Actinoplanes oblitus]